MRHLNLPFEWQETVIRAAITLQLCSFEQTGAIVAALTTSVPEAPNSQRNWDYRYCWIRDAYFTVLALNRVGASVTMERFIDYVTNVISMEGGANLRPVYAILPEKSLEERIAPDFAGYRGHGPVRIGNAAVDQVQHDVYGSVILAASQMFFDERLPKKGDEALFVMLEPLGMRALALALTVDAGIWEYRDKPSIHTYSAAMCWVACDRLARIATRLGLQDRAQQWRKSAARPARGDPFARLERPAERLHRQPRFRPYRRQRAAARRTRPGQGRRSEIHLDRRGRSAMRSGARAISSAMPSPTISARLRPPSPFARSGMSRPWPRSAGRTRRAACSRKSSPAATMSGLLSEDIDPETGELWGNFPQTYSLVGIILCAWRLSKNWEEAR